MISLTPEVKAVGLRTQFSWMFLLTIHGEASSESHFIKTNRSKQKKQKSPSSDKSYGHSGARIRK